MLAFRLTFLLTLDCETKGPGEAEPYLGFLLIRGKLSMNEWKVFLVSSLAIFDISLLRRFLSALNGEIFCLLLFY